MKTRKIKVHPFVTLLSLLCALGLTVAGSALAGGRAVNLAEMTAAAGRVVHGRVAEVRPGRHPRQPGLAVVFVRVAVAETLKGAAARELSFMQYAGGGSSYHLPQYRVGEEVVLFLYPESRYGLTSPVGEGQGKFTARDDAHTGRRVLLNERGNHALFDRLDKTRLRTGLALSRAEREVIEQPPARGGEGAEFAPFRSLVRKIAANPRAAAASTQ
jgi:hypothetical protein